MPHERAHRDRLPRGRAPQGGLTILELLITLAVVGMVMLLGYQGIRALRDSSLREDTTEVAAVLRTAYNMATVSGIHHRVVFDLDEQTYRVEACEGDVTLRRSEREQVPEEDEADDASGAGAGRTVPKAAVSADIPPEVMQAVSPEEAASVAEALSGTRVGTAKCKPPDLDMGDADGRGSQRRIRTEDDVRIRRMFVQHLEDEQREGIVYLNFFPLGYAEKAVIEVGDDDDNAFTLLVHRLTGRVEFRQGTVKPDEHMRRRADGEEVNER